MRTLIASLLLIVGSVLGGEVRLFSGARFDEKVWSKLRTYDVRTLSKDRDSHVGQLIELRFQFRSRDIRHLKPNWHQASLWQTDSEARRGFVSVPVMIADGDVAALKSFTSDSRSSNEYKVYGQVLYDFGANFVFVKLLGTSTFVDESGFINVTW